jgi:hypothetical protein
MAVDASERDFIGMTLDAAAEHGAPLEFMPEGATPGMKALSKWAGRFGYVPTFYSGAQCISEVFRSNP